VIDRIGPEVTAIFAVDDACPDRSGDHIRARCRDPRVQILCHDTNKGVGGAMMTGYRAALAVGAEIIVKIDGDGQMDPGLLPLIVGPVANGDADYAKGNRFHSIWNVREMPALRLIGNSALSFLTKLSSGYWSIFDPTNGYTAIHADALRRIEFANVSERYFFETDMLINLGNVRAVVVDVPMEARYGDEQSNLKISQVLGQFLRKNLKELLKRILYTHFMRDFSLASAEFLVGTAMIGFGTMFGAAAWYRSVVSGEVASTGTVMLATLPIILGFQLLLSFLGFDMQNEPRRPLQSTIAWLNWLPAGEERNKDAPIETAESQAVR
jgi:glycosyltransferase involved in cell wall biosynthesis